MEKFIAWLVFVAIGYFVSSIVSSSANFLEWYTEAVIAFLVFSFITLLAVYSMPNSEPNPEASVARDDESSNADD